MAFYNEVAPTAPVSAPRAYFAAIDEHTSEFIIVMEDLAELENADHLAGLSIGRVHAVLDELARFHAWGWDLKQAATNNPAFLGLDDPRMAGLFGVGAAARAGRLPRARARNGPLGLVEVLNEYSSLVPGLLGALTEPATLVNGDLRADNLFFSETGPHVTVDYQFAGRGCGMWDVAYLVGQGLTPDGARRARAGAGRSVPRDARRLGHRLPVRPGVAAVPARRRGADRPAAHRDDVLGDTQSQRQGAASGAHGAMLPDHRRLRCRECRAGVEGDRLSWAGRSSDGVLAYRAWVSEREKHERLELVYQASRILQHSPQLDVALQALLDHARSMFRAELAEVVIESDGAHHRALRTSSLHDGASEVIVPIEQMEVDPALQSIMRDRRADFVLMPRTPGGRDIAIRQAMVAPLVGEGGVIGLFTIANRLAEGTEFGTDDLRLLETIANQAAVALENGQLEQSLAELSRLKEQLRYQAYHDPLTDLPNRAFFVETATLRIQAKSVGGSWPVTLLLDLDDFKNVNDTLGHAAGDELLLMVGERIRSCIRGEDLAARLGGDEFAILIDDQPTLARSLAVAERLIELLGATFPVQGHDVVVGVSIGIAMSRGPDQPADELLGNADIAMYTAKAAGRRRFAVFDPSTHAAIIARHEMTAELARGIAQSELVVMHQPIVDLESGRAAGVEALVRWQHPTRGLIEPDDFISLAEESGSIVPLGRFVMEQAAMTVQGWNRRVDADASLYTSINVSALHLQRPDFLDEVDRVLASTELPPERLVLEITETAMFRDTQATIDKLEKLRARGVRIAIDDFGTGYASLTYLRRFPVDYLKIAKEFIGPASQETPEWAFTGAILALGRRLGLTVIAEGIEDDGQLQRLRQMGCEYGQGFLFARPMRFGELERQLAPVASPAGED